MRKKARTVYCVQSLAYTKNEIHFLCGPVKPPFHVLVYSAPVNGKSIRVKMVIALRAEQKECSAKSLAERITFFLFKLNSEMQLYYLNSSICIHTRKHALSLSICIFIHTHTAKHAPTHIYTHFYIQPVECNW